MKIIRPRPKVMGLDYETFCEVSLPDVGTSVYAAHDSCEVLMAAWAFDDEPVDQWATAEGYPMPAEFEDGMLDDRIEKWAWNAPFEITISESVLGLPIQIESWRDTMVQALHNSLPGKLEKAGPVVDLDEDKLKDRRGSTLMRKFSIPRKPTKNNPRIRHLWHEAFPDWQDYLAYNRQDVETERAIRRRTFPMPQAEWETWFLDQRINRAGLPINIRMVRNAITIYEQALGSVDAGTGAFGEMAEITGLANPNSPAQLLPWMQDRGYVYDDCKKGHIEQALDYFDRCPDHWSDERWQAYRERQDLHRVLQLRLASARTSIKKYYALDRATSRDGNLRNVLQMNGAARTGRWAGRIYQPQNLPRPEARFEKYQELLAQHVEDCNLDILRMVHGDPFDVLASTLRPSAQAPEGFVFIDADLSAIENRVLGWLSRCDKILDVFRLKRDPYVAFAAYLYARPYEELFEEYKAGDKSKRTIAKPGTLGAGYGMGPGEIRENRQTGEIEATGLLGYAWNMGVKHFTVEDSQHSIDTFRTEFSEVKSYWYDLERAAKRCVRTGKVVETEFVRFDKRGPFMRMILPSGRPLYYLRPRLEQKRTPWGEMRETLTYEGLNDRKQWARQHTTPGKIVENADQAISRDLLVHGMKLAHQRGIDIRLHVHDQIVGLAPEDKAEEQLKVLIECMEERPSWATDLPLGSEGHITRVFVKD